MTKAERRWAFGHAKSHAIESIKDTIDDERHSVVTKDDKPRVDIQEEVDGYLREFLRLIRSVKFKIAPPSSRE